MLISYITDKECFCFLYVLLGGKAENIPEGLRCSIGESAVEKLERQGYIHRDGGRVNVERTMNFLIASVTRAEKYSALKDKTGYIFDCGELFVAVNEDRHSPQKCRIVPLKDKDMLDEYISDMTAVCGEENG